MTDRPDRQPECEQGLGVPASPSGRHPAASAANAEVLWSDEIEALVDWGFSTVSRNPSDYEVTVAYRRAIAQALRSQENSHGK